jgi:tetratricopeptide (TPR) repeat protein
VTAALGLVVLEARTLNRLGYLSQLRQQWEAGLEYLQQALELLNCDSEKNPAIELFKASTLHWLGAHHTEMREWAAAEEALSQSLALRYQFRHMTGVAETLLQMGIVYQQTSNNQSALICFEGSLAICKQLNYVPALLQACFYKAGVFYASGRYKEALALAQQAVEIGRATEQNDWLAKAFFRLGQIYHKLQKEEQAIEAHLRVARLYRAGSQNPQWIELLIGVGDYLLGVQERPDYWQQGLSSYRYAITLIEKNERVEYLAPALGKMGRAFLRIGDVAGMQDAARCYRIQLQLAGDLDSVVLPPEVAVAMRVEALMGLQRCAALQVNKKYFQPAQNLFLTPTQIAQALG